MRALELTAGRDTLRLPRLAFSTPAGVAVLGAKKRSHLEDSLSGADLERTPEDLMFLRAGDAR